MAFATGINFRRLFAAVLFVVFASSMWTVSQTRGPRERTLTHNSLEILSICFSPDGGTLAIASGFKDTSGQAGRIELWDTDTGKRLHVIKGFDGPVWSVSFSPDGGTLVSASSELHDRKIQEKPGNRDAVSFGELKWWDAKTGEFKQKVRVSADDRSSVMAYYSPDGKTLATVEYYSQTGLSADFGNPIDPRVASQIHQRAMMTRRSIYFGIDLKLVDSQTGEVKTKLQGGYRGQQPGYSGLFGPMPALRASGSRPERTLFSPDGQLLAEWTPFEVKFWEINNGREISKIRVSRGMLNALAFSPDGRTVACAVVTRNSGGWPGHQTFTPGTEVRFYEISTGKVVRKITGHNDVINSLAFGQSGRVLILGTTQYERERTFGTIKLWDLQSGTLTSFNAGEDRSVDSLVLSQDERHLAVQTSPSTVEILDPKTWQLKHTFDAEGDGKPGSTTNSRYLLSVKSVLAAEFSPDGKTVAGVIEQGGIKVWDPRTGEVKKEFAERDNASSLVTISRDGKTMAETGGSDSIKLWDLANGASSKFEMPDNRSVSAIALSSNGSMLAIGAGADVSLRDATSGNTLKTLTGHHPTVSRVAFSDNGQFIATASDDGTIEIWDLGNGQLRQTLSGQGRVNALRFAPDGQWLATANADFSISLWDIKSGSEQLHLKKHKALINGLAFSPDGQLLASGGDDKTVIIWETSSGRSKRTLKGHDLTVNSVSFSPDGQFIASGCGNASVVLWNVKNGTLERVLR
jgi:WD40 repeat protein